MKVYFGEVSDKPVDWRKNLKDEVDPDDDELEETPEEVIDFLGFDPKKETG